MLAVLNLEMSVGSTDKDVEKNQNQLWIIPFQVAASLFVLWLLKK